MELDRKEIQGLVMSGYASMHYASYLLVGIRDPGLARSWLTELAPRVTAGDAPEEERSLNIAVTSAGLASLGVDAVDLRSFPVAFREGIAAARRSRILGDLGQSSPDEWEWGGPTNEAVHLLVMVFAKDTATFERTMAEELGRLESGGLEVIHRLSPERLPGRVSKGKFGVEHFGFADGMSQPVIRRSGPDTAMGGDDARRNVINSGEFVLGYPNGYDKFTPWPKMRQPSGGSDFGRNGSYLVLRQLAQDVAGFWQFIAAQTGGLDTAGGEEERIRLAAKLVGRWPSGAPLVKSDHRDDPDLGTDNSFGYSAWDPHGIRCPVAAHIRRSNPRDSLGADPEQALRLANLHRILRRGRVYGPELTNPLEGDDGQGRGLFFMCLNANLERQFEFIQHSWCNNPKFAGLYDEPDPLISSLPNGGGGNLTIRQTPVRRRLLGIPNFVTTRGGAYFFLPSVTALCQLGRLGNVNRNR